MKVFNIISSVTTRYCLIRGLNFYLLMYWMCNITTVIALSSDNYLSSSYRFHKVVMQLDFLD